MTNRNRKIGDIVWDEITPSCGPLRDKTLGLKRGRVSDVFTDRRGRESVQVEWFGDMEPQTGTIRAAGEIPEHSSKSTKYDWGVVSAKELDIIVKGGLLDGKDGCFDIPQCDGLIALHPLYQLALDNPGAAVVINPDYSAILPAAVTA